MAKHSQQFQTIRTEGAILPPDILRRIASLKVEGATPDAYHLPPGTKLNEAISQSWTSLLNHWQAFQKTRENLPGSEQTGTAVTNERWLLPLFKELDYGRLVTTKAPEIDERLYPIERFYNHTPIHLIGCKLPLDRRTKGARGAATASPHSMVQEFLNRSDQHLWAVLSNGLQFRIFRDNVSLSRQAFVEFDLEAMMDGEVYADFALLWLLCHQSRVESDKAVDCWLEKWSKLARDEGTRVLTNLRVGVKKAIEALGRGFIGHPRNDHLCEKLRTGSLTNDEFYRQLLRTVYRLLFLFVAEDRELLHPPEASAESCNVYDTHYSTRRLRELANKIRGSKHADLWHSLSLVFDALSKNEGCPKLGLSGLGSFLWRANNTADLLGPHQAKGEVVFITNDDLLQAVRTLAYVEQDKVLRIVDYRNLGSEELGSVYESLLELHPVMNAEARTFELSIVAGNERKTTGSYYTPDFLVQCLLDSALDPVIEDRLKKKKGEEAEQAILEVKICDPACGSGHFLIAAAHRLARYLARVRTGEAEPSPDDYQHALRDIIGRCVYGVDLNPMAIELCKVSLWMEAIEPGKPLSFLDHHIRVGNSLLGATPKLIAAGLPDEAFNPIEGDDKQICSALKKRNKKEREGQRDMLHLMVAEPESEYNSIAMRTRGINETPEHTIEEVQQKAEEFAKLVRSTEYLHTQQVLDAWCSAFVWEKQANDPAAPLTSDTIRRLEVDSRALTPAQLVKVELLSNQYQFFHWHLTFPDVFHLPVEGKAPENEKTGWDGGFDVVLGNPPWEMVELSEKEYFAEKAPKIVDASTASRRKELIAELEIGDPALYSLYKEDLRQLTGTRHIIQNCDRFPEASGGRVNLYPIFAELDSTIVSTSGRSGVIVPSAISTDAYNAKFFSSLINSNRIASLFDFENRDAIFSEVHRSYRFCLLTLRGWSGSEIPIEFCYFCHDPSELKDPQRRVSLTKGQLALFSPNTLAPPILQNRSDACLALKVYGENGVLLEEKGKTDGVWKVSVQRMLSLSDPGDLFRKYSELGTEERRNEWVRLFSGKAIHQFNHRFATYDDFGWRAVRKDELFSPNVGNETEYYVRPTEVDKRLKNKSPDKWLIGYRDIARATDEVTVISTIIPRSGCDTTYRNIYIARDQMRFVPALVGNLNSYIFNFFARQKVIGTHLNAGTMEQLPALQCARYSLDILNKDAVKWMTFRILELTYTAWDLEAFALDCSYDGPPFRWNEERRFLLRCELDAAYFHLYLGSPGEWGIDSPELHEMFPVPRDAVEYIMETFPIVKRKGIARTQVKNDSGKVTQEGRYITKDTILEIYDEMAEAIRTGQPYQTRLNPPPGPPTDAEGNFLPVTQWDPHNWPPHVHPAKERATE